MTKQNTAIERPGILGPGGCSPPQWRPVFHLGSHSSLKRLKFHEQLDLLKAIRGDRGQLFHFVSFSVISSMKGQIYEEVEGNIRRL